MSNFDGTYNWRIIENTAEEPNKKQLNNSWINDKGMLDVISNNL